MNNWSGKVSWDEVHLDFHADEREYLTQYKNFMRKGFGFTEIDGVPFMPMKGRIIPCNSQNLFRIQMRSV